MKIKTKKISYEDALALEPYHHRRPKKPSWVFSTLMYLLSKPALWSTHFSYKKIGMEKLGKKEPCLYLMNHSSFIDLKIASGMIYPRPYNIVCTSDGFVGKAFLMRNLGCIPTKKFVPQLELIRDMMFALKKLKSSVLMYPEAGYSFDGTATVLPDSLGKCVKMLGVPVVMIRTHGTFLRDPLYNNLQTRKIKITAEMEYLISPEDTKRMTPEEINDIIQKKFTFDHFRSQYNRNLSIKEPFRADYLNRVLYKCPHCMEEGQTEGKGTTLTCHACGKVWELTEKGQLKAKGEGAETEFTYVSDWYAWERQKVREEIEAGEYRLDTEVDIALLFDTKALYMVGEGRLIHNSEGFFLFGCNDKLNYTQKPLASYSLNSDYYWYEIGDVISIGNQDVLYYCFPKGKKDIVTKARLATEELYKIAKANSRKPAKKE